MYDNNYNNYDNYDDSAIQSIDHLIEALLKGWDLLRQNLKPQKGILFQVGNNIKERGLALYGPEVNGLMIYGCIAKELTVRLDEQGIFLPNKVLPQLRRPWAVVSKKLTIEGMEQLITPKILQEYHEHTWLQAIQDLATLERRGLVKSRSLRRPDSEWGSAASPPPRQSPVEPHGSQGIRLFKGKKKPPSEGPFFNY
jgi:hypothetical protein